MGTVTRCDVRPCPTAVLGIALVYIAAAKIRRLFSPAIFSSVAALVVSIVRIRRHDDCTCISVEFVQFAAATFEA